MIEFSEFAVKFKETLGMESSDAISATSVLKDLAQWDSLAVVSIIAMFDNDYNVWLSGNDIRESKTVGDLFSKINRKTE